ncbi:MAG: di-heme oxidoredictase family protein [Hyphomicrobium sp.]
MKHALLVMAGVAVTAASLRAESLDAALGKALFDRLWVPAPATTNAADGLGPLFNARGCVTCHRGGEGARVVTLRDGRRDINGAVVRFGAADGATDPTFGQQLQTNAVPGLAPEGVAEFLPKLSFKLEGGQLAAGVHTGARLAPSLFGIADFDQVADDEILKRADPDDSDSDGISGRANRLPGGIGRFGWKAAHISLADQIAHALATDIGLSSPLAPRPAGDCTVRQTACLSAPNGESAAFEGREVSSEMIRLMSTYLATVKLPAPKSDATGAALFVKTGCAACHTPELATRQGQFIPAFTDLLLHDMGNALDDGVGEPGVAPSEWRTAPLRKKSNPRSPGRRYLHDGSAATIGEAVSKHGAEGAASRKAFDKLSARDRRRLVNYVMGL